MVSVFSSVQGAAALSRAYQATYAIGVFHILYGVVVFLLVGMYLSTALYALAYIGAGILYLLLGLLVKRESMWALAIAVLCGLPLALFTMIPLQIALLLAYFAFLSRIYPVLTILKRERYRV